jgi:hypothetical protein
MVTGKVPFDGNNFTDILIKHLTQAAQPPSQLNPEICVALEEVILKAISKRVEDRFQKIEALFTALERAEVILDAEKTQRDLVAYVRDDTPVAFPVLTSVDLTRTNSQTKPKHNSLWLILLGVGVLLASFVVFYWLFSIE